MKLVHMSQEKKIIGFFLNSDKSPTAKNFRKCINTSKYQEPSSARFWLNIFNINLNETFWKTAYDVTQESRLRELQWKILHNIYPTHILLFRLGITDSNKCPYCTNEIDYIEHFFFKCNKIRKIWNHIEELFELKFGLKVKLNTMDVLLGREKGNLSSEMYRFLNHLILIGKMCISKFRYGTPIDIILMFENEILLRGLYFKDSP